MAQRKCVSNWHVLKEGVSCWSDVLAPKIHPVNFLYHNKAGGMDYALPDHGYASWPSEYAQELRPSGEVHEPHSRQLPQDGKE